VLENEGVFFRPTGKNVLQGLEVSCRGTVAREANQLFQGLRFYWDLLVKSTTTPIFANQVSNHFDLLKSSSFYRLIASIPGILFFIPSRLQTPKPFQEKLHP
jgi:hypothetical protein